MKDNQQAGTRYLVGINRKKLSCQKLIEAPFNLCIDEIMPPNPVICLKYKFYFVFITEKCFSTFKHVSIDIQST